MEGIITLTLTLNLGVGVEARPESDRILVIQLVVYFFLTARLYVLFSERRFSVRDRICTAEVKL